MIVDFPTKDDFFNAANDYLNLAWGSVVDLLRELEGAIDFLEDHKDESEKYWDSAKKTLMSATALIQQAIEFYIKGRIVDVSPYLLISASPQFWPKGCNKRDTEFSMFRTIDAQDLLRVHDTVCNIRFTDEFTCLYNDLRVIRNKVMHTVDKNLNIKPEDVISYILFVHNYFFDSNDWLELRRIFLRRTPLKSIKLFEVNYNDEPYILNALLCEFRLVTDFLTPSKVKLYFDFDKKIKSYHCPNCYQTVSDMDFWDSKFIEECGKTYQKKEYKVYYECCICHHNGDLVKKKCEEDGCDGTILHSNSGACLSCFAQNFL